ncbi:hypothetical protein C7974DRAFT_214455 [Boeremia exigua]|uniref:uncharacterized protein n=1 Tax=Boeremia exigua TaxID=749465 RepID=UPI001E8D5C85|nr:uncharacterized protein C7974DRAFT_214455 [Boeremia exigua]KAH6622000.1 hypothetical protein C7974DRAFT_214455 [Boeremia exigua]
MAPTIQAIVVNPRSSYDTRQWHGTLMAVAVILVGLCFKSFLVEGLPNVETEILFFYDLVHHYTGHHNGHVAGKKYNIWSLFLNQGAYESKGLSFFVTLIAPVFDFTGVDGAVHMSEEVWSSSVCHALYY